VGSRGRKAGATNKKRGGLIALSPRTFKRAVAWRVDQDYAKSLSLQDMLWLAAFNDRYYGADFRETRPLASSDVDSPSPPMAVWSDEDKREVYRANNRANRDLMTCAMPVDMDAPDAVVELGDAVDDDLTHLDDAEYKAAREAYRADPSPANRVRLHRTTKRR
jgi:hypothetical protein